MSGDAAESSGTPSCAEASAVAHESHVATASEEDAWLVVEWGGAWGRDVLADTELPPELAALVSGFDGRVLLVRRPGRRAERGTAVVYRATATADGGTLTREFVGRGGSEAPVPVAAPLLLVCAHGRRDACCARLGVPVYDALAAQLEPDCVWQSSHQGGHRFAANVLVLPAAVQLGRVSPADASRVAALTRDGRIPLDLYRGRTLYPAPVQAAEICVRRALGLDRVADVVPVAVDGGVVRLAVRNGGEVSARVTSAPGPAVPPSCGAEPEPTTRYDAVLVT